MKKLTALLLCVSVLTVCAFAYGGGTGDSLYTNITDFADELALRNDISENAKGSPVETFALKDGTRNGVYPIVLACDTIYGGMNLHNAVAYAESLGYNVVAAVNGDFGFWETRVPLGMVVENGIYKSSPEGLNAIAFSGEKAFVSESPSVDITISNDTKNVVCKTSHLNKSRRDEGLWLYSEYFSTVSTRTTGKGWFVLMEVVSGELRLSGEVKLRVSGLISGEDAPDAVAIGKGNFVLTASEAAALGDAYNSFAVGDEITISAECSDGDVAKAEWVSGCGNIIVKDSEIYREDYWDKAIIGLNPRTAVGITADGSLVFYVTDGRRDSSAGSTMRQLADDLVSMGCVCAVNMDGGGSSVLAVRTPWSSNLTVVNRPSDGSLRSVCSYIFLVTDEKGNGRAERLFLKDDGAVVLAGSGAELSVSGIDRGFRPVDVKSFAVSAAKGTVSGGVYTAPAKACEDRLSLSSGGASGSGTIHVISAPDSITVFDRDSGLPLTGITLDSGEKIKLGFRANYLSRTVCADPDMYVCGTEGGIGEIDEDFVFTASGAPGAEGGITVELAGVRQKIRVGISFEFEDTVAHWAREYVKTLYEKGIVRGISETKYGPDLHMKRCDFLVMLWRAAGSPVYEGEQLFGDVPSGAYYCDAVNWAASNGIAMGADGKFMPESDLTREQGFTFLHRALPVLGFSRPDGDLSYIEKFPDSGKISEWAKKPSAALIEMGIVSGDGEKLNPGSELTRAEMAKILCLPLYGG